MEHTPHSPDLALNDFWLLPKIKSALKGQRFKDTENIQKGDNGTESFSITEVSKMFPTLASLDQLHSCTYNNKFICNRKR
jgi:hypothetical protein